MITIEEKKNEILKRVAKLQEKEASRGSLFQNGDLVSLEDQKTEVDGKSYWVIKITRNGVALPLKNIEEGTLMPMYLEITNKVATLKFSDLQESKFINALINADLRVTTVEKDWFGSKPSASSEGMDFLYENKKKESNYYKAGKTQVITSYNAVTA